jgi:uncharacterized protein (TIGR03032 family)
VSAKKASGKKQAATAKSGAGAAGRSPSALIIVAPPRSGAGLFARLLAAAPGWGTSGLSDVQLEDRVPGLAADRRDFVSHALPATDAKAAEVVKSLARETTATACTVDWNPRLALRIGLVARALPDARFLVVSRRFEPAVASLTQAWRSRSFATLADLPGWWGEPWAFPLVEGWRDLIGKPLPLICLAQWARIAAAIQADLEKLPRKRWAVASFESLVADPAGEIKTALDGLGLEWPGTMPAELPRNAAATPAAALISVLPEIAEGLPNVRTEVEGYRAFLEAARPKLPWPEPQPTLRTSPEVRSMSSEGTAFAYAHSQTISELLEKAGATLAITTYKTGHVLLARSENGKINAEVKVIQRAMGMAVAGRRLAIGAADTILSYWANAAIAPAVQGPHPVDTAYLPRSVVHTGEILVHEMAYGADGALYFVNTRFSCLCRLDLNHSFVPVWRPPWVTALAAEDRCHLNGLAMVEGRPRYMTALSRTDTRQGWRELKGTGGVLVEVPAGRVVAEGLVMPHSPRWHRDRLWVLESGRGTLAAVDPTSGRVETVATLPGFTRGLAFIGRYAIVGLSQVRETVFDALPITEGTSERWCGVAVVDTETGALVGALRFSAAVQEIFDVAVLPCAWPTIVDAGALTANAFVVPDRDLSQVVTGGG